MIKEEKTIFVSVLTVLVLGFSNLLITGKLLFTFPINDYLLLIIGLYLVLTSLRNHLFFAVVLFLFLLSNLLSSLYNYEFLLSQEQLSQLSSSLITDTFQLLTYVLYLMIWYLMYARYKEISALVMLVFSCIIIVLMEYYTQPTWQLMVYLIPFLWMTFFAKKLRENFYITYLLLFLHVFLLSTKLYTLYLA